MATRKKQKSAPETEATAPATAETAGKPAAKRKAPARKAAEPAAVEPVAAAAVEPVAPVAVAPVVVAPVVAALVEPAPRPTRQQIAARAFWYFHHGSRDTLGNWLRAERDMADVVARGHVPPPGAEWVQALAER